MMTNTLNHRICFIHVPKCGGTSISSAIRRQYGIRDRISRHNYIHLHAPASLKAAKMFNDELWSYREKLLIYFLSKNRPKFVSGHFGCSERAMHYFSDQWHFITVIRDPVERWFSHYFFNRYKKTDHFKTDLSIEEYIDSAQGQLDGSLYLRIFSQISDLATMDIDECYKKAVDNLGKLSVVGTLENLDTFTGKFKEKLGVKLRIKEENMNPLSSTKQAEFIDDSVREKVREICRTDVKIYDYVVKNLINR